MCVLSSHDPLVGKRWLHLGVHMDPMLEPCCSLTVGEWQLALHLLKMAWNQRPVTSASQLCLWKHACVRVCMDLSDSVSMCMHVYQHALREGEPYHGTCFLSRGLPNRDKVCVCVRKGGRAGRNNAILCVIRGRAAPTVNACSYL